jgi:protein-disulfide isomerase
MTSEKSSRSLWLYAGFGVVALLGAAGGWWLGSSRTALSGPAPSDKAAIEEVVRNYLLEHPEILPQAMERLQQKEASKQLANVGEGLTAPFPGAVLGNPEGSVTLVEFTDFACGYCRASLPEVEALILANPNLKVVVRELPILSPASGDAARWALAAAEQGKFAAFHKAMFAAGRPDAATIEAAAAAAGLDVARARRVAAEPRVAAEINRNLEFAQQLKIEGTPTWVVGEQLFSGAVGRETLQQAIDETKG